MKIIIEATNEGLDKDNPNPKTIIETKTDDVTATEAIHLVACALIGWGYAPSQVKHLLEVE